MGEEDAGVVFVVVGDAVVVSWDDVNMLDLEVEITNEMGTYLAGRTTCRRP